jgi:hypothetical protein
MSHKPSGRFSIIGKPLMVIPWATASSRAAVTMRLWLLAPSPEMSITCRTGVTPLWRSYPRLKSMAPDTDV